MELIFDRRTELGATPGLHALIAGVSNYPHLPAAGQPTSDLTFNLRGLTSTSLSAWKVAKWLVDHPDAFSKPLATVRLLVSPTAKEREIEPQLDNRQPCTVDKFLAAADAWRKDAAADTEGMTLFYFAGHGVERGQNDSVMLLEGFNAPGGGGLLDNAVDIDNITNGMAPSSQYPNIALTQLYFVDACRDFLKAFKELPNLATRTVFDPRLPLQDRRCWPIYFAAAPGTQALAVPNDATLFTKALLACLEGGAGRFKDIGGIDRWHISAFSLGESLDRKIERLNQHLGGAQEIRTGGQIMDKILGFLTTQPSVEVSLAIDPTAAGAMTQVQVEDLQHGTLVAGIPAPFGGATFETTWPAGIYSISAKIEPPNPLFQDRKKSISVDPPVHSSTIKVG